MRIGALAAATGTTAKTIRFYEQAGLLPGPPRTTAGYRDYPDHAAARLAFIRAAQSAGLTLAELRGILAVRDPGPRPCCVTCWQQPRPPTRIPALAASAPSSIRPLPLS